MIAFVRYARWCKFIAGITRFARLRVRHLSLSLLFIIVTFSVYFHISRILSRAVFSHLHFVGGRVSPGAISLQILGNNKHRPHRNNKTTYPEHFTACCGYACRIDSAPRWPFHRPAPHSVSQTLERATAVSCMRSLRKAFSDFSSDHYSFI